MKKIAVISLLSFVGLSLALPGCGRGGSSKGSDNLDEIESIVNHTDGRSVTEANVDSLALMADDLTPIEAAQVLATYTDMIGKMSARSKKLETMRKFVDVYDIVMTVNGSDMRQMFENVAQRWPQYDPAARAKEYREQLADYADGSVNEESSSAGDYAAPVDSTKTAETDSIN